MGGQRLWLGKIRPRLSYGKYELLDMETATKDGAHITIKFKNKESNLTCCLYIVAHDSCGGPQDMGLLRGWRYGLS